MMDGDGVIPSGGIADAPVVNASTSLQSNRHDQSSHSSNRVQKLCITVSSVDR